MEKTSTDDWKSRIAEGRLTPAKDFAAAIRKNGHISIIGEVKRASPSKGVIRDVFDAPVLASEYAAAKADALSVLTERDYFMGSDSDLEQVRETSLLPLLRKDFIIDVWQIYQSRFLGADAILLIVKLLGDDELRCFRAVASIIGLQCLFEVHEEKELERALKCGAVMIGINNRNLDTFNVSLETTAKLAGLIPRGLVKISESGIHNAIDLKYAEDCGMDGVLVGEAFMKAGSIMDKMMELRGSV